MSGKITLENTPSEIIKKLVAQAWASDRYEVSSWLVGCFGFNDSLRQYFSLYPAVSQREGEIGEKSKTA